MHETAAPLTYEQRLSMLRAAKLEHTRRKQERLGSMDSDDQGQVLPPDDMAEYVAVTSGSGIAVRQPIFKDFTPVSNHPSGGFFGPKATGENFERVDTRVLQVIYVIDPQGRQLYVGQQVDVFIDATPPDKPADPEAT